MGIVNSLFAEAEFANVQSRAQTHSESNQVPSQETGLEPKPKPKQRPKSGPGGYGSHLTKEEIDYWVKKVPITY